MWTLDLVIFKILTALRWASKDRESCGCRMGRAP